MAFSRILVDVDAAATAQPALDLAVLLARRSGAHLRIVDITAASGAAWPTLPPETDDRLWRRHEWLARLLYGIRDVSADADVLSGYPGEVIVREAVQFDADLVIRSRARDLLATGAEPYGPVNAHLLRHCPCAVLALAAGGASPPLTVCAALDAEATDSVHEGLNEKVLKIAASVNHLIGRSLTVLHAWQPAFESRVQDMSTGEQFGQYLDSARRTATSHLAKLISVHSSQMAGARVELRRGGMEDVVPQFAVSEGVDLVVVGTMGRCGLIGRLLRSTTDRLVQRVPCSYLAVKPDGVAGASS